MLLSILTKIHIAWFNMFDDKTKQEFAHRQMFYYLSIRKIQHNNDEMEAHTQHKKKEEPITNIP